MEKHDRNWLIALIGAGHFFSHFVMLALPPLFLLMKQELGVSYVALGAIVSVMATTTAVGQIPVGFLVDRIGGRVILLCGIGLMSVSLLLVGFLSSYWALFALFALAGMGNSVFHPADFAIMAAKLDDTVHGRAFSIHSFTGYLGWASAALIMLPMAAALGWRLAIMLVGVAGLAIVLAMMAGARFLDDRQALAQRTTVDGQGPRGVAAGIRLMASLPMLMMFAFFALSATVTSGIMAFSIPANVMFQGLAELTASLALTAHLVASAVGVLIGGWLADRTGRHNVVTSLAMMTMVLFVLLLAFEGAVLAVTLAAMIGAGMVYGISSPSRDVMIKNTTPLGSAGVAFGFTSSGMSVGNLLGPLICGWIMDAGRPQLMYMVLAGIAAVSIVAVVLTRSRQTQA
ncbi:MAG: MFS transporter [Proteobacteria bacterium]|nr:MFS transporter [Pseudomonadota bacterium]